MKIVASAPGKLILLGEYSVLEGAPALVAAVNRYARVIYRVESRTELCVTAPTLGIERICLQPDGSSGWRFPDGVSPAQREKLHFAVTTLNYLGGHILGGRRQLSGGFLQLDTDDFFWNEEDERRKLGLGSSAAITVALLAALLQAVTGKFPEPARLFRYAMEIHRLAQGKVGSGIDVAASVQGGILRFQSPPPDRPDELRAVPLTWPPSLQMIPVWSGHSASTTELVGKVNRLRRVSPKRFREHFDELSRLSEAGCRAFAAGQIPEFLETVEKYCRRLERLGADSGADIVSEVHRRIADLVHSSGGVYKPSGAGGGDLGIAFCESGQAARELSAKLLENGFSVINLSVEQQGVTLQVL